MEACGPGSQAGSASGRLPHASDRAARGPEPCRSERTTRARQTHRVHPSAARASPDSRRPSRTHRHHRRRRRRRHHTRRSRAPCRSSARRRAASSRALISLVRGAPRAAPMATSQRRAQPTSSRTRGSHCRCHLCWPSTTSRSGTPPSSPARAASARSRCTSAPVMATSARRRQADAAACTRLRPVARARSTSPAPAATSSQTSSTAQSSLTQTRTAASSAAACNSPEATRT